MTRAFVCLAAALGMMMFSGCGQVQGGGVAVAPDTTALKPLPPAPEDRDLKIPPPPLAPTPLPAGVPPGLHSGEQPFGQPAAGDEAGTAALPGTAPADPPASGGSGLLQGLLGGGQAEGAATPIASGGSPAIGPNQITLSDAKVSSAGVNTIRFEVSYEFTQGHPAESKWYSVTVSREPLSKGSPWGYKLVGGKSVLQRGKFDGVMNMPGSNPVIQIVVREGTKPNGEGRLISNIVDAPVSGETGHAAVDTTPPSASGGGLLQGLFGSAPAAKAPPLNGSSNLPHPALADLPAHISLFGTAVTRINKDTIHFEFGYNFDHGKPVPTNWYTVVVEPVSGGSAETPPGEKKYEGKDLQQNGKLESDISMGGRSASFAVHVMEGISQEDKGHVISLITMAAVRRNLQHLESDSPLRPAVPGVGAQGKGYGAGIVTAPVAAFFGAKEKITFDRITNAMNFFKAQNNRNPSSQEEFMDKIIKDNGLTLPELPAGERYIYDPQDGVLKYGPSEK